ncbi:hypothetical protein BBSC_1324 [Bifidobacterium scardovii JCM 12489 = DSM 13734]|nr:hypothetical protein BBSC_1324 [Bifidobacterium scardovii JCM 12489 = DSM 13734]
MAQNACGGMQIERGTLHNATQMAAYGMSRQKRGKRRRRHRDPISA